MVQRRMYLQPCGEHPIPSAASMGGSGYPRSPNIRPFAAIRSAVVPSASLLPRRSLTSGSPIHCRLSASGPCRLEGDFGASTGYLGRLALDAPGLSYALRHAAGPLPERLVGAVNETSQVLAQGSSVWTPRWLKSLVLRVTTVMPCARAIAAIHVSLAGRGPCACRRA